MCACATCVVVLYLSQGKQLYFVVFCFFYSAALLCSEAQGCKLFSSLLLFPRDVQQTVSITKLKESEKRGLASATAATAAPAEVIMAVTLLHNYCAHCCWQTVKANEEGMERERERESRR